MPKVDCRLTNDYVYSWVAVTHRNEVHTGDVPTSFSARAGQRLVNTQFMRRITIGCTGAAVVSFFARENLSPPPGDPYRYPTEPMNPPIHDNVLNGYEVDGVARRIVLHTVYEFATPQQFTDVIFDGVLDHYLRDTLLPSILYDIEPADAEEVVHEHLAAMQAGFQRNGWPSFFDDRTDVMLRNIANSGCRFYVIGSSFGLDGWILAKTCKWTTTNHG